MKKQLAIAALLFLTGNSYGQQHNTLTTPWTQESLNATAILPEYPRPQLVRNQWTNLNGLWSYAITDSAATTPIYAKEKIRVPYPVESALSGVQKTLNPNQRLWYKRSLTLPATKASQRVLLHFGAVDYEATVYVNNQKIGTHTGGYQAFSFDITDAVKKGNNELVVSVLDPSDQGNNPHGKQVLHPEGIMYTPSSGIWQTVWLETVPTQYVKQLKLTPDTDHSLLQLQVDAPADLLVEAVAWAGDTRVGTVTGRPGQVLQLPVSNMQYWSPDTPFLYQLTVALKKDHKTIDQVSSYFGMRKIEIKNDAQGQARIFLNNRVTFNLGVLDQGYWPDGLHTAPTDKALLWDVQTIKDMGFNTIRKHIKIEPARWYYHCDRLGMLVWQDMPFPANLSNAAKAAYEKENAANVTQLYNYPSIVCWVLFNEGWMRYDQQRLTQWMQQADSTRLIDGHSGENYDRGSPKDVKDKWVASDMTDVHEYPGPGIPPAHAGKARVLGEWGGVRVPTPGHQWNGSNGWGYIESTAADYAQKYRFMIKHLKIYQEEGLSASIFTQPFDVEIEENGLVTYDRKVFKIPVATLKAINGIMY